MTRGFRVRAGPRARARPPAGELPGGARQAGIVALVVLMVLAGCATPPAGRNGPESPTAAMRTGDVAATAAGPSPIVSTGHASPGAPTTVPASTTPAATDAQARPSEALLAESGAVPVAGTLGSWTFENSGSDSPWLPAAGLREVVLGAGAGPTVRLATGEGIGAWSAQVAAADDTRGEQLFGAGGRETAEPALEQVELEPLQAGRWVLAVRLELADGRGDATWYWLLSVR